MQRFDRSTPGERKPVGYHARLAMDDVKFEERLRWLSQDCRKINPARRWSRLVLQAVDSP